jgi:hypothetical protein
MRALPTTIAAHVHAAAVSALLPRLRRTILVQHIEDSNSSIRLVQHITVVLAAVADLCWLACCRLFVQDDPCAAHRGH